MTPPSSLDSLVETARAASVRTADAERHVAELDRWARREVVAPRPWWRAGLLVAAGALAAAAVLLWWGRATPQSPILPVGERVAVVAEHGTRFRVTVAAAGHTEILVEQGTVTARLWKGASPLSPAHSLVLRGGGVVATATGTVYSLSVGASGAAVRVHEGAVQVDPDPRIAVGAGPRPLQEAARLTAGHGWPAGAPARGVSSARRLLALAMPTIAPGAAPGEGARGDGRPVGAEAIDASGDAASDPAADAAVAASVDAAISAAVDAAGSRPAAQASGERTRPDAGDSRDARDARPEASAAGRDAGASPEPEASAMTLAERWRLARLRRGQGKFQEALRECLAIADTRDVTWAPIALAEAMRLTLGPLADPQHTLQLARRMRSAWPRHTLMIETRAIECRALKQLGRSAECAVLERGATP
ncbi:MAG: hypothetical protein IPI49_14045 [Myxococcales bacterium]|nr:hypothetical protein [Myxococcales bacterium]